jgi:hypothetical protein
MIINDASMYAFSLAMMPHTTVPQPSDAAYCACILPVKQYVRKASLSSFVLFSTSWLA